MGDITAQERKLLLKLRTAGLNEELARGVNSSLAEKMVRLIQTDASGGTTDQKRAREIMGTNFFGVEESVKYFGVNSSRQQLAVLSEIPFSEAVLEKSKNTHILVAVFPLSILEIRKIVKRSHFYRHEDAWYNKQNFTKECGEAGWQLILKTSVKNSTSENWQEQQALVSGNNEVPGARVMVYGIIGHSLATGERLFENIYVRTSSVIPCGGRIGVGRFDIEGLHLSYYWDDCRDDGLGVSSTRKI
jgi:hypothetical protein